jgi:drug/metabolite transporter (DMT)-like permease
MSSNSPAQSKLLGYAFSVIAAICFGCSLVLARVYYDYGTNPESIIVMRFAVLLALLLIWNLSRGKSLALPTKLAVGSLLVGMTYFIGIGSYLSAVAYLPVSLAVLIFYTFPIVVAIITAGLAKRWPHPLQMVALLVAFAGLIISLDVQLVGLKTIGLVFAAFASLGIAINMIWSSYFLKQVPTTVFGFYMSIGTLLISSIVVLNRGSFELPQSKEGLWVFVAMLMSFIVGYFSIYNAIRIIGAAPASTILNLEPVVTIVFAVLLLGELFNMQQLFGGAIVLIGILMSQWPQLSTRKK